MARFENGREETANLLVGGDGAWSAVRQKLLPKIAPEYAAMWLGAVSSLKCFARRVARNLSRQVHVLSDAAQPHSLLRDSWCGRSATDGKRRLNWVWYWNYREAMSFPRCSRPHRPQTAHIGPAGNGFARNMAKTKWKLPARFSRRSSAGCWKPP